MSAIRLILKPSIFTLGVCGTCYCGSVIAHYERNKSRPSYFNIIPKSSYSFETDWVQRQHNKPYTSSDSNWFFDLRRKLNLWKNNLTTGEKITYAAISINFAVWGAWRFTSLRPVMYKFFTCKSSTSSIALSPMILSCFSHSNVLHFTFNMCALYSFSDIATYLLSPERLIGFYISAGAVSSLASVAYSCVMKLPRMSLGASGAILGVVAYVCMKQPDASLRLLFIPIAASDAIKCLLLFDTVGLLARWKIIDHAAHLGGTLFGLWFAIYGEKLFHKHKKPIIDAWLEFSNKLARKD